MDAKDRVPKEERPSLEELLHPPLSRETSNALDEVLERSPLSKGLDDEARQWINQIPQEKQTAVLRILSTWTPPIINVSSSVMWIMQHHFGYYFYGLTRSIKQRYNDAAAVPCQEKTQKVKNKEGEE